MSNKVSDVLKDAGIAVKVDGVEGFTFKVRKGKAEIHYKGVACPVGATLGYEADGGEHVEITLYETLVGVLRRTVVEELSKGNRYITWDLLNKSTRWWDSPLDEEVSETLAAVKEAQQRQIAAKLEQTAARVELERIMNITGQVPFNLMHAAVDRMESAQLELTDATRALEDAMEVDREKQESE